MSKDTVFVGMDVHAETIAGHDPEQAGGGLAPRHALGCPKEGEGLLRGGTDGVRTVLAADRAWSPMRCRRAVARPEEGEWGARPSEARHGARQLHRPVMPRQHDATHPACASGFRSDRPLEARLLRCPFPPNFDRETAMPKRPRVRPQMLWRCEESTRLRG
jgi:hypothetical protein